MGLPSENHRFFDMFSIRRNWNNL